MNQTKYPLSRIEDLICQETDIETLIYDLRKNKALCLNQTSYYIWQMCNGSNSVEDIREKLSSRLNVPVKKELVWFAIDELRKEDLIENLSEDFLSKDNMSRREIIKKVGVTSVIALPIITSMVAPTSVTAQSCLAPGTPTGSTTAPDCSEFNSLCCNNNAVPVFMAGTTTACRCSPVP